MLINGLKYLQDGSSIDFDNYTVYEIEKFIEKGYCTEANVRAFYNNEWWAEYESQYEHKDDYGNVTFRYPRIQVGNLPVEEE